MNKISILYSPTDPKREEATKLIREIKKCCPRNAKGGEFRLFHEHCAVKTYKNCWTIDKPLPFKGEDYIFIKKLPLYPQELFISLHRKYIVKDNEITCRLYSLFDFGAYRGEPQFQVHFKMKDLPENFMNQILPIISSKYQQIMSKKNTYVSGLQYLPQSFHDSLVFQ